MTLFWIFAASSLLQAAPAFAYDDENTPIANAACEAQRNRPWVSTTTVRSLIDEFAGKPGIERVKALAAERYKSHGYLNHPMLHPFNGNLNRENLTKMAPLSDWEVIDMPIAGGPMLYSRSGAIEPVPFGAFIVTLPVSFPLPRSAEWTARKDPALSVELPKNWVIRYDVPASSIAILSGLDFHILTDLTWAAETLTVENAGNRIKQGSLTEAVADSLTRDYATGWKIHDAVRRFDKPGWECYTWTMRNRMSPAGDWDGPARESFEDSCQQFKASALCSDGKRKMLVNSSLPHVISSAQDPIKEAPYQRAWQAFERILRTLSPAKP